jgi:hypothetical protein
VIPTLHKATVLCFVDHAYRYMHVIKPSWCTIYLQLRCGAEDETSAHTLCGCEALASLRHVHLGSFFLEPEDIKNVGLGAIWNFGKVTGLPWIDTGVQRARQLRPRCIGAVKGTKSNCNQSINQSSVYSITIPLHVSGLQVAHHQEVTIYTCNKWYML